MKLEYISHSCFVIESNGTRLAFDPWITPTAYNGQWHLYPMPLDSSPARNADVVMFSHGHEDHFNHDSLTILNKNAHVFFPFQWRKGVVGYLNHMGFKNVTEAVSFREYRLGEISVTYLGYSLESVIVVECEGFTIVNINDALNSNHETAVEYLLKEIKTRWPEIDFLLSGWSGAGYFPNKVHYAGKDDVEVARIREQYFANNFCRFTNYLKPEAAIAFAPGFVLLGDDNRWINEIKFPREILTSYYREHFDAHSEIRFPLTYPGDYFEGRDFHKTSPYHSYDSEKEMYSGLEDRFKSQIEKANAVEPFSSTETDILLHTLTYWLNKNKSLYHPDVCRDAVFSIRLMDVQERSYLNISFENNSAAVLRSSGPLPDDRLLIETKASLLALNFKKEWGGDLLSIGYGINVHVYEEHSLEKNLDVVCVRLISRFPNFKDDFISHAPRALRYDFSNPGLANLWLTQKMKLKPFVNKYPFNERDHWITYKKCDLCKVCNMPEVEFG